MIQYDLAGTNSEFTKEDSRFVIYQSNQVINFNEPVFLSSIVVKKKVGTSWTTLTQGAADGWTFTDDNKDVDAMSDALLQESSFNCILLKSIILKCFNSSSTKTTISVSYQRLRKDLNESFLYDGNGPEYSPSLMAKVIEELEYLKNKTNSVTDLFGYALEDNTYLEEDLTGVLTANYVTNERHVVNSSSGNCFISPAKGSFYGYDINVYGWEAAETTITNSNKASLYGKMFIYTEVINNASLNTTTSKERRVILSASNANTYVGYTGSIVTNIVNFTSGTDFSVVGINLAKTEKCNHTSGVYEHIKINRAYVGNVMIAYHAFGGSISRQDVLDLQKNLSNLVSVVKGSGLLTDKSLTTNTTIISMIDRLSRIEEFHNHFAQVEHIVSPRDALFHWYNIAFIYDDRWSGLSDAVEDLGQFRIESLSRNWAYEFQVTTNLSYDDARKVRVKTLGCADSRDCSDFANYSNLATRDTVYVRACWINDGKTSGIALQYGMRFNNLTLENGVRTDTVIVTNKSGNASRWRLYSDPLEIRYPSDDAFSTPVVDANDDNNDFVMPNGFDNWNSNNSTAKYRIVPLEPSRGYIYWAGVLPLHQVLHAHSDVAPFHAITDKTLWPIDSLNTIIPEQVSGVSFDIYDRKTGCYFAVDTACQPYIAFSDSSTNKYQHGTTETTLSNYSGQEAIFCLQDLCAIRYRFTIIGTTPSFIVSAMLGTNSIINERFDLRQIRLHFN